jgi:hypothetical protein
MSVTTKRIILDASGRLRVYPDLIPTANYDWIYRDASSVRWNDADRSLHVLPVDGFTPVDELNSIVSAVEREYGEHLVINAETIFDVPRKLAERLVALLSGRPLTWRGEPFL